MQTIKEMSGSMEEMKNQIAQVSRGTRQSLESGPTFAAGTLDAESIATVPKFLAGWVRDGGNVTPLELVTASATMSTQFVNVEIPNSDTAFNVPSASQPIRGHSRFAVQDMMMQGTGGMAFTSPQATAQTTIGTTLQDKQQHNLHLELMCQ